MKFGKHIQSEQVPGWSAYYLDYKFLKKIISSLAANRPASEAAVLALGIRPADILLGTPADNPPPHFDPAEVSSAIDDHPGKPPIFSTTGQDEDRGPDFQAHKAAFFFKLERELEKVNAFYLQKEAELQLRLETLLSKRRAAAMRGLPETGDDVTHVEWSAVEEGFRLLERDLGKLQQFIEVNATGFRKILKKFDKRSTSSTKELYLARQVDVQPVFNRQLISELSDTVAACLVDLTDLSSGLQFEGSNIVDDVLTRHIMTERTAHMGPFNDLENNLRKAVASGDESSVAELVSYSGALAQQEEGRNNVTRILWNVILEAPSAVSDFIMANMSTPFDFQFVDDINGRTCLHEAAMAGAPRLVDICLAKGVQTDKADVYGRSALHYSCMNGHAEISTKLLEANLPSSSLDKDNYSPLIHAILRGSVDCVRVLLEKGHAIVQPPVAIGDLMPLSLASQSGHVDVVLLLLQHGARCTPNTNGEYPMHLAAREGHANVCHVLLHLQGWDKEDKYHEWTPLFHAARYGHEQCIQVLLEAGSRVDLSDEVGHLAIHYAAWYGHHASVRRLLAAASGLPTLSGTKIIPDMSPISDRGNSLDTEIDLIPSLSLPPPIMPHRVYGHNYLDHSCLVQVSVGSDAAQPAVRLHPRLAGAASRDKHLLASASLKLVMTTGSEVNSAPYTISLPQRDERGIFVFQTPSLSALSLEFSVYPNFGTKTIGRAVALPSLFQGIQHNQAFVLPILDSRLHVIGEVTFEVNIITPFDGVTLQVGGAVETYWKSMGTPIPSFASQLVTSRWPLPPRSMSSAQTSPSNHSIATSGGVLTISSLSGSYVYVVVQVTRDLHAVVYADWTLPETGFDLGVADVTLAQFEALSSRLGRDVVDTSGETDAHTWHSLFSRAMISVERLMEILPMDTGVSMEFAYPSRQIREKYSLRHTIGLNQFVDSALRSTYHTSTPSAILAPRRKIIFTSFTPDVCAALNWKQPNYPVFYASHCGKETNEAQSADRRSMSLGGAVEFAKSNNLLGVFLDAELLAHVPSLIQGIRDAGLLVGVYGTSSPFVDASIANGVVACMDHSMRELF